MFDMKKQPNKPVEFGTVENAPPPEPMVEMMRPEDRACKVVAMVGASKVPEWEAAGWKVKE